MSFLVGSNLGTSKNWKLFSKRFAMVLSLLYKALLQWVATVMRCVVCLKSKTYITAVTYLLKTCELKRL